MKRSLFAAAMLVAALGAPSLHAQSAAAGRVILEERFESGDDTSRKRFIGPSFNIPDTWELRDGAVASIFDPVKKKGHGHPISPRCGVRDIRVSYRARLDSDKSSLSVVVDGDWPNKTGLPLWHIGDVNVNVATDGQKPDVSLWERRFTRDMNDPAVKNKEWKPNGLLTDMNVLAPAYFGMGGKAERRHVGLKTGQWYRFAFEIIGTEWAMWVDGEKVLAMTQPYSDCDKPQVCFLGFGPLMLDDIVVEELPRPKPHDLVIVAGGSDAVGVPVALTDIKSGRPGGEFVFRWRSGGAADSPLSTSGGRLACMPVALGPGERLATLAKETGFHKTFGPEFGLAQRLQKDVEDRGLAILKVAVAGSSLKQGWNPFSNGPDGECYRLLRAELLAMTRSGREQEIAFRPRALVFMPGIDDAPTDDAESSRDLLANFVKAFRGDLSAQGISVVLVGKAASAANVQKQVAESLPRCIAVDGPQAADGVAMLVAGGCLADAILEMEKRATTR